MAEALKHHFSLAVARRLAEAISAVWAPFDEAAFLSDVGRGFDALELMDRGRHIARVLRRHLPADYREALAIVMASVGPRPSAAPGDGGMASFFYLPHVCFVAEFGLDHFDESMQAQYVLTQRFTAEFSVRPFIERDEARVLALFRTWARDPNVHVRRLVSEGSRPRLPWAARLRRFQRDPTPVLGLLELLKDDPELYVRRSVANSLNDIGKDHPDLLVTVARRWMVDTTREREALVRHALRSLVKQGHPGALRVLGVGRRPDAVVANVVITPARVALGRAVTIEFHVRAGRARRQRLLVDLRVHFVKARGGTAPKVFKLRTVDLGTGEVASFRKTISLADLTTRQHYPGRHMVDAVINGQTFPLGEFRARSAKLESA